MRKKIILIVNLVFLISVTFFIPIIKGADNMQTQTTNPKISIPDLFKVELVEDEVTTQVGDKIYGLIFDNHDKMYVVRGGREILTISPKGEIQPFCKLVGPEFSSETYIWSIYWKDGFLYAPAMDRVLKIDPSGKYTTIINDPEVKPVSLTFDNHGTLYVASQTKIWKYNNTYQKNLLVDCGGTLAHISLGDIIFDSQNKNLYVSHFKDKLILRYPILPDGSVGKQEIIFSTESLLSKIGSAQPSWSAFAAKTNPSWFAKDKSGNIYISLEQIYSVLKIGTDGSFTIYELSHNFYLTTLAFGNAGFDEKCLYSPGYRDGYVHKFKIIK